VAACHIDDGQPVTADAYMVIDVSSDVIVPTVLDRVKHSEQGVSICLFSNKPSYATDRYSPP
jgi:hypothetical protein